MSNLKCFIFASKFYSSFMLIQLQEVIIIVPCGMELLLTCTQRNGFCNTSVLQRRMAQLSFYQEGRNSTGDSLSAAIPKSSGTVNNRCGIVT